jgi:hypothetical protein
MVVKVSKPEVNIRAKLNELEPKTLSGDDYILDKHSHNGEYIKNGIAMYIDAGDPACFPHSTGGGSGSSAFNLDGYFPDLLNSNITKSAGGGGSFAFAGNGTLSVNGRGNYNMNSSTCEAWFRSTGNATNGYHVIMQKNGGYSGAPAYGLRAGSAGQSSNMAWYAYGPGSSEASAVGAFLPIVNEWYHMVSTVDLDNGTLSAYINGRLHGVSDIVTSGSVISDQGFNIGTGDGRFTYGEVAIARVYNRPLSNSEICYNYLKSLKRIYG